MKLADTTVVVLVPESGDAIQTMKAGLMEAADVFLVNKADRAGAPALMAELKFAAHLHYASSTSPKDVDWEIPVLSAQAQADAGIAELLAEIRRHRGALEASGALPSRRRQRLRAELEALLVEEFRERVERGLGGGALRAKFDEVDGRRHRPVLGGGRHVAHGIVGALMTTATVPFRDTFWNIPPLGARAALRRRRRGHGAVRLGRVAARRAVARGRSRGAPGSDPRARESRRAPRARSGPRPVAGLSRGDARHHVLGLPGPVHGHGAGHHRLRHHAAAVRLQAPEGRLLPLLRDGARPLRALLRHRPRHGGVATLRPAARPGGPHRALREGAGAAVRDQPHRLRHGGLPAGGGQAVVGGVVAGGVRARDWRCWAWG